MARANIAPSITMVAQKEKPINVLIYMQNEDRRHIELRHHSYVDSNYRNQTA